MKQIQLDDKTARDIYPTAAPELKKILEQNWSKERFKQEDFPCNVTIVLEDNDSYRFT